MRIGKHIFGKERKAKREDTQGPRLTSLAAGSIFTGECRVQGDMRVDGTIRGNIHCTGRIVIGPEGSVQGNIECEKACLYGNITGDAIIWAELMLKAGCRMQGNISAQRLEIEQDAEFNGTCSTGKDKNEIKGKNRQDEYNNKLKTEA